VAHDVGSITVTPSVASSSLSIYIGGNPVPSGTGHSVSLTSGVTSMTVTVTVKMIIEGRIIASQSYTITVERANQAPNAQFTPKYDSGESPLTVEFDATESRDPDGSIDIYAWDFGDGVTASGVSAIHIYDTPGTYTVILTVTDDDGATNIIPSQATIVVSPPPPPNLPPTASFTATPQIGVAPLTVEFNITAFNDPDGTIVSYDWDFGDGHTASTLSDVNVSNIFTAETTTTYTVTLTVTDDDGATSTCTEVVTVEVIPWPMARHDASQTGYSPRAGIDNPWMIPITFDGYEEVAPGSPLLIGREGIIFLVTGKINRPEEIIAVRADSESPETCQVLWRFPLYTYAPCPAIGSDGTVYVWDVDGTLVGLDPDSGTKVWDSGYDGKRSYLYDIQVSRDGIICASTSEGTLVYSSAPEHQLIYQLNKGGYPLFAPNGTLYLAKVSGDKDKILAVDQDGQVMWEKMFTNRYRGSFVFLVDQESTLYRWEKDSCEDKSTPYITVIACDGLVRWERAFPDVFHFSEPLLGPDGTLYVMTRAERNQGEIFLHAINTGDGTDRWSRGLTEILSAAGVAGTVRVVSGYNNRYAYGVHSIVDANGVVYVYLSREWNRKEDGELLLIDGNTGDLIQRIVNAGQNYIRESCSKNMAMNSDGTLYLASVDSLMATVPNEPPRIVDLRIRSAASYHYPFQRKYEVSYSEPSNAVGFWFECIIDDPLWGGRNLTLTWDFGDGTTKSQDIAIRKGKYPQRRSEKNPQGYLTYKVSHTYDHPDVYFVTATLAVDGHSETFVQDGILACGIPPTLIYMSQEGKGSQVLSGGVFGGEEVDLTFIARLPDCLQRLLVGNRDIHFYWNLHNAPGFGVKNSCKTRGEAHMGDPVSITYCYTRPGTYKATLKVWENDWPIPIERTVWVKVVGLPTSATSEEEEIAPPSFTVEVNHTTTSPYPKVNIPVTFFTTVESTSDEPISTSELSYNWDFDGDDEIDSSVHNPSYSFENAGNHTVKVKVNYNDRTVLATHMVGIYSENAVQKDLACLTITAEEDSDPGNLEGTYTSNVLLNGFLGVDNDSIEVWSDDLLTSDGNFVVYGGDGYEISTGGGFAIKAREFEDNNECYRPVDLSAFDFIPTIPIYGFNVDLADFKLYDGTSPRLTITGTIKPIFPWTGNFKEISLGLIYSQNGRDFLANAEKFEFKIVGFGISEGSLELDTHNKSWEASACLQVPIPGFYDILVLIGFLKGELNKVGFGVDNLNIAIGGPPPVVILQKLEGGLDNLAEEDPIVLTAESKLTAGPEIKLMGTKYSLLGGTPNISIDTGGKLTIGGELYFLKKGFGTFGEAKLVLDIAKGLYLRGQLMYPPGDNAIFVCQTQGKVDFDGNFQGRLDGTISTPRTWWLIGDKTFANTVGYIDNDLISTGVKIGDSVCIPGWGCYNLQIKVSVTYEFDDGEFYIARNWNQIQEVTLDDEAMAFGGFQYTNLFMGVGDSYIHTAKKLFPRIGRNVRIATKMLSQQPDTLLTHRFDIPEGSMPEWEKSYKPTPEELQKLPVYIFRMESTVEEPSFTLEDPDGNVYDRSSNRVLWQDHVFYKDDTVETWESWCAVPAPKSGRWTLYSQTHDAKAIVQAFHVNEEPSLTITTPGDDVAIDANSGPVHIAWIAEDPDGDDVTVQLCYTEDQDWYTEDLSMMVGNTIGKDLQRGENQYDWDITNVPPGRYRILGVVTDVKKVTDGKSSPVNSPVFALSEGSITVKRNDFLPPENVSVDQDGSTVQVKWDSVPGATGYRVYYQNVNKNSPLSVAISQAVWEDMVEKSQRLLEEGPMAISQAVWEDTNTELRHLKHGVTYRIAVTAFNDEGLESDYSELIEVTFE